MRDRQLRAHPSTHLSPCFPVPRRPREMLSRIESGARARERAQSPPPLLRA